MFTDTRIGSEVLVVQRCVVCVHCSGGRLEIGISAISTVICMLVKSLGTSSFTQTPVINYAPYLFYHIFIHLSSSPNSSLSIPTLVSFVLYVFYIHYLFFSCY
jgi:hypothetical protein